MPLHQKGETMTWDHFDARLRTIEKNRSAAQERVDGKHDQRLAKLFVDSGRSQQELANHLAEVWSKNVAPEWVSKHIRFGRFLSFFSTVCTEEGFRLPPNLTEGGFRALWENTTADGNYSGHRANTEAATNDERRRFAEVIETLRIIGLPRNKKQVQARIIQEFKIKPAWLTIDEILERISKDGGDWISEDVYKCLRSWQTTPKAPYRVEQAGAGRDAKYRVVRVKGQVISKKQVAEWAPEMIPLLDDLIRECRKDRVEVSLTHLASVADKLKKVFESIKASVPASEVQP
jgi:hypothetical protein